MTSYVVVCTTQTFDVFSIPFKPVKLQDTNFVIQTREMIAFVPSYIFRCCLCLSSLFLQCKPLLNFPINLKAPYKSCHLFQRPCVPSPCQNGGTCFTTRYGFECKCKIGFVGELCETIKGNYNAASKVIQFQPSNLITSLECSIIIRTHADDTIDHFHKWRRILLLLCIYVN